MKPPSGTPSPRKPAKAPSRTEIQAELAAVDALEQMRPVSEEEGVRFSKVYLQERRLNDAVLPYVGLGAPGVVPPAALKSRLMERIAREPQDPFAAASLPGFCRVKEGVSLVSTREADWTQAPLPGVEFKVVHQNKETGYTTRLLRLAAGAGYPPHKHAGTEEIFVLSGTVLINGRTLGAGDYCRSEPGTFEEGTYTPTGATALVISCDQDEVDTTGLAV